MNILYLTTSFPPFMEAHTIRNVHYMNRFIDNGDHVLVCAPIYQQSNRNFNGMLNERINVVYTRLPLFERIGELLKNKSPNGLFMKGYNYFINFIYPDSKRGWDHIAKKILKKQVNLNDFDCVISASGSYTAHILAAQLVREFPHLKWVAEYGDPWSIKGDESINRRAYKCEQNILTKCSKIIFTTQKTVDIYKKNFEFSDDIYDAIFGGYDDDIPKLTKYDRYGDTLRLAYIGVAYRSSRNLETIIMALKDLPTVTFSVIGKCSEHFKSLAKKQSIDNVKFTGQVPYKDSIIAFTDHDAYVIVGNDSTSQIPSKIYNYIASKKPIIYISQMKEGDPTRELLEQFDGILYCENNINDVHNSIELLLCHYNQYLNESINRETNSLFYELSWREAAQKMVNTVHKVVKG